MAQAQPHVLLVEDDADTREVLRLILVSAVSDLEARAKPLHPFAVLQKPVDPDELTAVVRQASEDYLSGRGHE